MSNSLTPEPGSERTLRSSTRNPRRRQRQSDADSLKTAPRRKRSKLAENTFVPPRHDDDEVNGTIEVGSPNGDIQPVSPKRARGRPRKNSVTTTEVSMPVREKKSSVKRPTRGDGATVLTQHARYSVKLLPSTPKELRREGVEYRGTLGAAHYALATTRERAYIWDYTAHATVSSPRIFDVPFAVKPTDPLPFGALVVTGTGTDFGLVIISAATGEVFFYESIERAASLGFFQDRKTGVTGSVGPFYSGESVVDVISADHAGFIVTLSSGRIAQLTLRDTQGRARVSGQFLKATEQTSGGLFGGLKGLLGGYGWTKDVAAVRTRPLGIRGQMQVVSLSIRGEVQLWDLDWSGQYMFKGTVDCREMITRELKRLESPEMEGQAENFAAVDFAILLKPSNSGDVATTATEAPIDLAVLLRSGTVGRYKYAMAEVSIEGVDVSVSRVIELDTYSAPSGASAPTKPHLVLPKSHHTAFVSFTDAVVLAAMEESEFNSPEAQLHSSYVEPAPFEDAVYLKQDGRISVLGACEEDVKTGHTSAIVFVKGAGLLRVSAVDPSTIPRLSRTPVKSKIEQAVFHGEGNIIDFSRRDTASPPDEVEQATLEISNEILTSTSPFVPNTPTSIEAYLIGKSQALSTLVRHVRQKYPALNHATMWRLLWDAERVAAALEMWKTFEAHVAATNQSKRKATVMDEACGLVMEELEPKNGDAPSGEDTVRYFFIHFVGSIDKFLRRVALFVKSMENDKETDAQRQLQLLFQASELWNKALQTVHAFRMENAAAYGILPELIPEGVLIDAAEYVDLPEFWTSTDSMLKAASRMSKTTRELAAEIYETGPQDRLESAVAQIGNQNPKLVEILCYTYEERINWLSSRETEKDKRKAEQLRGHYELVRNAEFRALALIAHAPHGMQLAEKYHDLETLAQMINGELQYAYDEQGSGFLSQYTIDDYISQTVARTNRYFEKFGDEWSNAYFDCAFSRDHAGSVLRLAQENWSDHLTRYLRSDPSRAKLCWIDDIWADKDYLHAQRCLSMAAEDQETILWAKRVELSMSKLALLAAQEQAESKGSQLSVDKLPKALPDQQLEVVDIQERLYGHLEPEIRSCIDEQAQLEVSIQKFGYKNQDLHSLRKVLEAGLERVLQHIALSVDELIDVLTLMDANIAEPGVDANLQGQEFFLALKALNAAAPSMPQNRVELLLLLIWKRCYIYDDWIGINSAQKQSDEQLTSALHQTVAWRTFYYAIKHDLFNAESYVRRVKPSDCLGSASSPEELQYRWSEPDILHPILSDNKIQDEQLSGYVTDRGLDDWVSFCYALAERKVEEEMEGQADKLRVEREFKEVFEKDVEEVGEGMNGHAKGPNGVGGHHEDDDDVEVVYGEDEDGDIEMA